jgi:NAD(P)-dependent dehydrogenase (short-subunit alcohol dehydrogenase family)
MKPVVLITGVAGGIGRETARVFSENGWYVIGIDRQDFSTPYVDRFIAADISDTDVARKTLTDIEGSESKLDALINNAAVQICKPLEETTIEDWDTIMNSNVRAAFAMTRYALPLLKKSKGAIVNVSSVHAVATSSGIAAYAASKGALVALSRAMAVELAPNEIRINAILPGAVDTQMLRDGLSRGHLEGTIEQRLQQLGDRHVMGRVGLPAEIAESILFLADGKRSGFITGQALVVDGGATARLSTE